LSKEYSGGPHKGLKNTGAKVCGGFKKERIS